MTGRKKVSPCAVSQAVINMLRNAPHPILKSEILEAIYGSAPDAPEDEAKALNLTISNLRKRCVDIECVVCFRLRRP